MTPDQIAELKRVCEVAEHEVFDLCSGKKKWLMSIPVREDCDSDRIILNALDKVPALIEMVERMQKVVDAARLASDEIQAQKTMWPGEVDDLCDAIKELDNGRSGTT